jgi:hypothetical protein
LMARWVALAACASERRSPWLMNTEPHAQLHSG